MNIRTFVTILSRKAQCNFPKMMGGGGSKAVWNFSENSSDLETCSVPYPGLTWVGARDTCVSQNEFLIYNPNKDKEKIVCDAKL